MSDHFHAIITPSGALERAMQLIKGGHSRRTTVEFGYKFTLWQPGFTDHRIRDAADLVKHIEYIHQNPVQARLCAAPEEYPYSSAHPRFELDEAPQGLKPLSGAASNGGARSPAPSRPMAGADGTPEGVPFQSSGVPASGDPSKRNSTAGSVFFPSKTAKGQI